MSARASFRFALSVVGLAGGAALTVPAAAHAWGGAVSTVDVFSADPGLLFFAAAALAAASAFLVRRRRR